MPSLLHKNSFFDPATGRQFIATDDGFYWKEAKKSPEDSKVTALMRQYGWELHNGNDVWLDFRKKGIRGEIFVIRGEKRWYFDRPEDDYTSNTPEGQGLASLQQALQSGIFEQQRPKAKAKAVGASAATTAVNNAGSPRQLMHDDSGAQTGLRMRPDYGESDSYTVEMNEANSKAALYVTGATFDGMVLEKFTYSADQKKAKRFGKLTAKSLANQLKGKFNIAASLKA